jgi:hypothetical protein
MSKCVLICNVPTFRLRAGVKGVLHTRYASGHAYILISGRGGYFRPSEYRVLKESKGMLNEKNTAVAQNPIAEEVREGQSEVEEQVRHSGAEDMRVWWDV